MARSESPSSHSGEMPKRTLPTSSSVSTYLNMKHYATSISTGTTGLGELDP